MKRKRYASELFHLTAAEIAEEEALYIEVKRMEQDEKRYRSERDVLMRSVIGLDSDLVDLGQHNGEGVVGMEKVGNDRQLAAHILEKAQAGRGGCSGTRAIVVGSTGITSRYVASKSLASAATKRSRFKTMHIPVRGWRRIKWQISSTRCGLSTVRQNASHPRVLCYQSR